MLHQDVAVIQTEAEITAGVFTNGKSTVADHGQGPVQLLAVDADGMADDGNGTGGQVSIRGARNCCTAMMP